MRGKTKHQCVVCTGTACLRKGANQVLSAVKHSHEVSVKTSPCLGLCGLAPAVMMDQHPMTQRGLVGALERAMA